MKRKYITEDLPEPTPEEIERVNQLMETAVEMAETFKLKRFEQTPEEIAKSEESARIAAMCNPIEALELEEFDHNLDGCTLLMRAAARIARKELGLDKAWFLREAKAAFKYARKRQKLENS